MDIKNLILNRISKHKEVRVADIVKATGFSRAYINRFFQELRNKGKIILLGQANRTRYVLAKKQVVLTAKKQILRFHRILQNKNLSEDIILDDIKKNTGIFLHLPKNVANILDYAFTEMLNNAIEHSRSKIIQVTIKKDKETVSFDVIDKGIGIFNNIIRKRKLKNELEAIQDLTKGKQTTMPKKHTGEGIFFTSKAGDMLVIQSSKKKLIFNNILNDIFIKDVKNTKGTKVSFVINLRSKRNLVSIFKEYSEGMFGFGKTNVVVNLYKMDTAFISRSQARRILSGLEKFQKVVLDFRNVETVGQAFADEVFRVWKKKHPKIKIEYVNCNENIKFMINRALEIL